MHGILQIRVSDFLDEIIMETQTKIAAADLSTGNSTNDLKGYLRFLLQKQTEINTYKCEHQSL